MQIASTTDLKSMEAGATVDDKRWKQIPERNKIIKAAAFGGGMLATGFIVYLLIRSRKNRAGQRIFVAH